ncbi:aliphatic sulfonate ABC transporter substrate-binding protein [Peterkaempfera sp. SMS 1(5)a]
MTRRGFIAALSATALSLSATSCSSSGSGGGTKVRFGYIADFNGSSLLAIADKQGLWKKAGLSPSIKVFTNGPIQIQALGAGDLDFGYIGPGALWLPATGKAKVIAIDTLTYADRVIAQPGITTIEGLRGKKVGVPEGTSGEMVLNLALKRAGMTMSDIVKVPMDAPTIVSAFSAGQIDGAGFWYPLIGTIKQRVPGLHEVASDRDFTANAFPTAFVSGPKTDPALTEKVVKVLQQANDWRAAHKDEAIGLAADLLQVDRDKVKADAANVEMLTTADLVAKSQDGTIDNWLNGMADFFVGSGQLKSRPAPSSYYDGARYAKVYGK